MECRPSCLARRCDPCDPVHRAQTARQSEEARLDRGCNLGSPSADQPLSDPNFFGHHVRQRITGKREGLAALTLVRRRSQRKLSSTLLLLDILSKPVLITHKHYSNDTLSEPTEET